MAFYIGLYVGRRHQPNGVAERLEFARPMMRRRAGFDADQARRQLLEEGQYIATLELTTQDDIALRIDAVNLKYRLRDVETHRRNRLHDLAPLNRGAFISTHIHGTHVPVEEPRPQHQKRTCALSLPSALANRFSPTPAPTPTTTKAAAAA